MRTLVRVIAAAALLGLPVAVTAADKPEDQAKEAALAFLKAVKAKDVDAAVKLADVPFLIDAPGKPTVVEKADDLKAGLAALFDKVGDPGRIPTDVDEVVPADQIHAKFGKNAPAEALDQVVKLVGKSGYVVLLGRDGKPAGILLVAVRDGKAKVVGVPR